VRWSNDLVNTRSPKKGSSRAVFVGYVYATHASDSYSLRSSYKYRIGKQSGMKNLSNKI
jgi:hypothetical protein